MKQTERVEAIIQAVSKAAAESIREAGVEMAYDEVQHLTATIVNECVTVTDPVYQTPEPRVPVVTLQIGTPNEALGDSSIENGICLKPGNVLLDSRKLIRFVGDLVTGTIMVMAKPFTFPIVVLKLWDALSSMLCVRLSRVEAVTFWVMLTRSDEHLVLRERDLLRHVNAELVSYGAGAVTESEMNDALGNLKRIECIEQVGEHCWQLKESAVLHYC